MASRMGPGAPPSVRADRDCSPLVLQTGLLPSNYNVEKGHTYLQGPKSAEAVEKEQEAKLKAKYGNLGAKKKLMPKVCCLLTVPMKQQCCW